VVLWRVAEALNRGHELSAALTEALARVCDLLDLQGGWVWARRSPGSVMALVATYRLPEPLAADPDRMRGETGCNCLDHFARRPGGPAANVPVLACSRLRDVLPPGRGARYHASVPLVADGRLLGVMNVLREGWAPLRGDELRLLRTVGHQAAAACERALLAEAAMRAARLEERNAAARAIHDSLAQDLAALVLQLEAAEAAECAAVAAGGAGECLPHLRRALVLARQAMATARRSVAELRRGDGPSPPADLAGALRTLAEEMERTWGVAVTLRLPRRVPAPQAAATILAVVREAATNAARHGGARRIAIRVARRRGRWTATVADDGCGFEPTRRRDPGHFGLLHMRERAWAAGGSLRVRARPGQGTRVSLSLPEEPGP
jgi:signal transduction histidine kinase